MSKESQPVGGGFPAKPKPSPSQGQHGAGAELAPPTQCKSVASAGPGLPVRSGSRWQIRCRVRAGGSRGRRRTGRGQTADASSRQPTCGPSPCFLRSVTSMSTVPALLLKEPVVLDLGEGTWFSQRRPALALPPRGGPSHGHKCGLLRGELFPVPQPLTRG